MHLRIGRVVLTLTAPQAPEEKARGITINATHGERLGTCSALREHDS